MKKVYLVLFYSYLFLMGVAGYAQDPAISNEKPGMAAGMRSNGKIYVVVAVVVTILSGLFIYLINLDRKISRMEKDPRSLVQNKASSDI